MYTNHQKLHELHVRELRREGGRWLKELREKSGHTQRTLAVAVGADYYTFISQIENGRGRIPPERYGQWAEALRMDKREFVQGVMRYYDPIVYRILFEDEEGRREEPLRADRPERLRSRRGRPPGPRVTTRQKS